MNALTTEQHEKLLRDYAAATGYMAANPVWDKGWQKAVDDASEARQRLIAEHAALLAEIERLRGALAFYADENSHISIHSDEMTPIDIDFGSRARAALK
jgi:hypothetical protein